MRRPGKSTRGICLCRRESPLDLYRTILRIDDARRRVFGRSAAPGHTVPAGKQSPCHGCPWPRWTVDFTVMYVESIGYTVDFASDCGRSRGEFVHVWLHGEAYASKTNTEVIGRRKSPPRSRNAVPLPLAPDLSLLTSCLTWRRKILERYWAGGTCGNVLTVLSYLGWHASPIARLARGWRLRGCWRTSARGSVGAVHLRRWTGEYTHHYPAST